MNICTAYYTSRRRDKTLIVDSYPLVGRRVGVRDGERVDDGVEADELFRVMGLLRPRTERAHGWVCHKRGRGHIREGLSAVSRDATTFTTSLCDSYSTHWFSQTRFEMVHSRYTRGSLMSIFTGGKINLKNNNNNDDASLVLWREIVVVVVVVAISAARLRETDCSVRQWLGDWYISIPRLSVLLSQRRYLKSIFIKKVSNNNFSIESTCIIGNLKQE